MKWKLSWLDEELFTFSKTFYSIYIYCLCVCNKALISTCVCALLTK